ncbi:MAG: hypothetical protein IT515_01385 [Burkholderiales bacterium]|nr:hypothetical protein [Burkholderiales bacterium]
MDPGVVLAKTEKGKEEIGARRYGLSQAMRHALILVDGRATVAQLLAKGSMIPGITEALEALLQDGFVRAAGGAAGAASGVGGGASAKQSLIALAEKVLGDQAGKVVKKLGESGDSPAELAGAVDGCHKLIRLVIDERKAEAFHAAAKEILARAG